MALYAGDPNGVRTLLDAVEDEYSIPGANIKIANVKVRGRTEKEVYAIGMLVSNAGPLPTKRNVNASMVIYRKSSGDGTPGEAFSWTKGVPALGPGDSHFIRSDRPLPIEGDPDWSRVLLWASSGCEPEVDERDNRLLRSATPPKPTAKSQAAAGSR